MKKKQLIRQLENMGPGFVKAFLLNAREVTHCVPLPCQKYGLYWSAFNAVDVEFRVWTLENGSDGPQFSLPAKDGVNPGSLVEDGSTLVEEQVPEKFHRGNLFWTYANPLICALVDVDEICINVRQDELPELGQEFLDLWWGAGYALEDMWFAAEKGGSAQEEFQEKRAELVETVQEAQLMVYRHRLNSL